MNNFQSLNKMCSSFKFLLATLSCVTMALGTFPVFAGNPGGAPCYTLGNTSDGAINSSCNKNRPIPGMGAGIDPSASGQSGAAQNSQNLNQQALAGAQSLLATCERDYGDCKESCEPLIASNPNDAKAKSALANCEARYKEAAPYFQGLIVQYQNAIQGSVNTGNAVAEVPAEPAPEEEKDRDWGAWIGKFAVGGIIAVGAACLLGMGACGDDDDDDDKIDCKKAANKDNPKCDDDDDDDVDCKLAANANHADCVIDCKLPKYMKHPNCIPDTVDTCTTKPDMEGCDDFEEEYCGPYKDPGIAPTAAAKSIKGEGVGTIFCDLRIAKKFCNPASRKESCPTCVNLAKLSSESCKANPSMCLPQMTDEDKNKAKVICPIDPVFSNPDFLTGKNEGTATVAKNSGVNNFGPTSTAAVAKGSSSWQGKKVAETPAGASSVGRVNRTVASAKVTHDISVASSANLFSSQSRVIAQRCKSGLVNNCGPRQFNRVTQ